MIVLRLRTGHELRIDEAYEDIRFASDALGFEVSLKTGEGHYRTIAHVSKDSYDLMYVEEHAKRA
jgi:hypothetical protein